jgi:hypothetical protein
LQQKTSPWGQGDVLLAYAPVVPHQGVLFEQIVAAAEIVDGIQFMVQAAQHFTAGDAGGFTILIPDA